MKVSPALSSALAAAALGGGASPAAAPEGRDEDVLVTAVTDDPCCGSGIVAFAVGVSGRAEDGDRSYFIPFMTPGQARPSVGELCAIRWRWWQSSGWSWVLAGAGQLREGREVTDFSCRKPEPERSAQDALMDEIETRIRLPAGAHRLDQYGRYYAFEGKRRVKAIYLLPEEPITPDPVPADWGCDEVVIDKGELATREIPCSPDPVTGRFLGAGQRAWVADHRALPMIFDGGCMVVHVTFDLETRKVEHAFCNGHG